MMKGNNELSINEATMCQIVQEWIDKNTLFKSKVTSVVEKTKGACREFDLRLSVQDEATDG